MDEVVFKPGGCEMWLEWQWTLEGVGNRAGQPVTVEELKREGWVEMGVKHPIQGTDLLARARMAMPRKVGRA